jgi:hypothetical protein
MTINSLTDGGYMKKKTDQRPLANVLEKIGGKGIVDVISFETDESGRVENIRIQTGPFEIDFIWENKRACPVSVVGIDEKNRRRVPNHLFRPAVKAARRVFKSI